jgi:hypothetical protein
MRNFQIYFWLMFVEVILYFILHHACCCDGSSICYCSELELLVQALEIPIFNCLHLFDLYESWVVLPYTHNVVQKLNHSLYFKRPPSIQPVRILWSTLLEKKTCKCARHSFNLKLQTACRISQEDRMVPDIYEGPRVDSHISRSTIPHSWRITSEPLQRCRTWSCQACPKDQSTSLSGITGLDNLFPPTMAMMKDGS